MIFNEINCFLLKITISKICCLYVLKLCKLILKHVLPKISIHQYDETAMKTTGRYNQSKENP